MIKSFFHVFWIEFLTLGKSRKLAFTLYFAFNCSKLKKFPLLFIMSFIKKIPFSHHVLMKNVVFPNFMNSLCQIGCVRISSGVVAWCFCKLDQILTTFFQKGFAKIFDCRHWPVLVKYQKLSPLQRFSILFAIILSTDLYYLHRNTCFCFTNVSFNDFANSLVFGTFSPPFSYSFTITDRLILSVFRSHKKWKMLLSSSLKNSLGGPTKLWKSELE